MGRPPDDAPVVEGPCGRMVFVHTSASCSSLSSTFAFLHRWVWIPDEQEGYLGGWVSKEIGEDQRAVTLKDSGRVRSVFCFRPHIS